MAFVIAAFMILTKVPVSACNENQTNVYTTQILFGDSALNYSSDERVIMLMNALYLCSEQSDELGQDKINSLKKKKIRGIPDISKVNLKESILLECVHNSWEYVYTLDEKTQNSRKNILKNTVNKVFDFGMLNNIFGSNDGQCNSFAALLYYSHILADYLADNPSDTENLIDGEITDAFSGQAYTILNGNKPQFSMNQKKSIKTFTEFSPLDELGRCGTALANIGLENMPPSNSRQNIGYIKPSGWNQQKYPGIVNSEPAYLYNRCHLIAHQLAGEDGKINLVTGTRYLNETGMKPFEDKVAQYIRDTGNHVLYRATPIYENDNLIVSGVQLEAYSVEDNGKGISFNVYCYNVQPGIELNYRDGTNSVRDITLGADNMLPFAVPNAGENKPDLIYEMSQHLAILFEKQKTSNTYMSMNNEINAIANQARTVGDKGENPAQCYIKLKEYEYKYFDILKCYVPLLLQKEKFFKSAFSV